MIDLNEENRPSTVDTINIQTSSGTVSTQTTPKSNLTSPRTPRTPQRGQVRRSNAAHNVMLRSMEAYLNKEEILEQDELLALEKRKSEEEQDRIAAKNEFLKRVLN